MTHSEINLKVIFVFEVIMANVAQISFKKKIEFLLNQYCSEQCLKKTFFSFM